jgi:hypothetical protein
MASEISTYQRLPGKKKGFLIGYYTLWQGADHLLQVYSRLGVEDYKRFYFNDIQAIITHKTAVARVQNIILGSLLALFFLFATFSQGGWSIFNGIVASVMLLLFLINIFKGSTCETYLLTAVQTEKLHSLNRLNTTQQVMNRLKSLIEPRQGRINPEILEQQSIRSAANQKQFNPPTGKIQTFKAPRHEKGKVHVLLFALLILDALTIAAGFVYTHLVLTLLGTAVTMLMGICVIVALVKQHESNLKRSVRAMTWAALGYVCFSFVAGYVISLVQTFKHPEIWQNQWELFKLISSTSPLESPLLMVVNIMALCGATFLGIPGLFMLRNPQEVFQRPSALPAASARAPATKRIS